MSEYGNVYIGIRTVTITATAEQLRAWARRPGNSWPCSELARIEGELVVSFVPGGLYDLYEERPSVLPGTDYLPVDGIPSDELNAWSSDVLRDVLPADHPAYFVTVGQFQDA